MSIIIDTRITDVTVYDVHALVTRTASVHLTGEEKELIFPNLPSSIEIDSIRVSPFITDPIKIMAVRTEKVFSASSTPETIREIDEEIKNLQTNLRLLDNQVKSLEQIRDSLKYLNDKSMEGYAVKLSRTDTDHLSNLESLMSFVETKYNYYNREIVKTQSNIYDLENQILCLQEKKQNIGVFNNPSSLNVIAVIDAKTAMDYQIKLSYLIKGAYWNPLYDLTAETSSNRIKLTYLAEVKQSTGEDWQSVNLTLSTAKPALGFIPPKPKPWYINLANHYALSKVEMGAGIDQAIMGSMPPSPSKTSVPEKAVATVEKTGNVVNFKIDSNSDIPSNGNPHKVTVFEDYYPYNLQYVAIPHLVSFAYLQTKIYNPQFGVTLLPGKANIFRDGVFVGTNKMEHIAPGQEFEINLGIDESIKIERHLAEHQTEKTMISNKKRITYAYRLTITNLGEPEKSIKLIEQLPVSRHEQLKVSLNQFNPKNEQKELGILEWNLVIAPHGKREIYYQYSIEYPPEYNLLGVEGMG